MTFEVFHAFWSSFFVRFDLFILDDIVVRDDYLYIYECLISEIIASSVSIIPLLLSFFIF